MDGAVYQFLGMTVGKIVHGMDDGARRAAYGADVTTEPITSLVLIICATI